MAEPASRPAEAASPGAPSLTITTRRDIASPASASSNRLTSLASSPSSVSDQAFVGVAAVPSSRASLKRKNPDVGASAGANGQASVPAPKRLKQAPSLAPKTNNNPSSGNAGKQGSGPGRPRGPATQRPQRRSKVGGEKAGPAWKAGKRVNMPPTTVHDVYVLGERANGALGLGSKLGSTGADDPAASGQRRGLLLNANLAADTVGVVQVACGAAHVLALTKDNCILTWGRNDWGALGRNTESEEGEHEHGHVANECTPAPVDSAALSPLIRWAQVVATDAASFALTEDGKVFGWGTFIGNDGLLGFSESVRFQETPVLVPDLQDIRQLAAGGNHVLALDGNGAVRAWGAGELNQLARKVFHGGSKTGKGALRPTGIRMPRVTGGYRITRVACGRFHSFTLNRTGRVFAWGLNYFAELGFGEGTDNGHATSRTPVAVDGLGEHTIVDVVGGENHSAALTSDGKVFVWGRVDGCQSGLPSNAFNAENTFFDERGKARFLRVPTLLPGLPPISSIAAGRDHTIAITQDGEVYFWGQSANFRTGHETRYGIQTPTLLNCTGRKMVSAVAGDEFSILVAERPDRAPAEDDTTEIDVLALGAAEGHGASHLGATHLQTQADQEDETVSVSQSVMDGAKPACGVEGTDQTFTESVEEEIREERQAAVKNQSTGEEGQELKDTADEEARDTMDEGPKNADASEEEDAQDAADRTGSAPQESVIDATPPRSGMEHTMGTAGGIVDEPSPAKRVWASLTGLVARFGRRRTGL